MEPMYFLDDDEDLQLMHAMRLQTQELEQEHLEVRVALRDAQTELSAEPENETLKTRVQELERKLDEINKKAPWICSEHPVEVLLFGAPHG